MVRDLNANDGVIIQQESASEKRWTIMAALLGANMAFALFHGLAQQENPLVIRELALTIVVVAIPFQGIYFMIRAYLLEHPGRTSDSSILILTRLMSFCQVIAYLSITGIAIMLYVVSGIIGTAFALSGVAALIMVRMALTQVGNLAARE